MVEFDTTVQRRRADPREPERRRRSGASTAVSPPARPQPGDEADQVAEAVTATIDARARSHAAARVPDTRIRRAAPADGDVVRRFVDKGKTWAPGKLGGLTGGGWLTWSQQQIDEKFTEIADAHALLDTKIKAAETASGELADSSPGAAGLSAAKLVYAGWNRTIEWDDRELALKEINGALAQLDGVNTSLSSQDGKERAAWTKTLGAPLAQGLLATRTPKELSELAGRVGQDVLVGLGAGVGRKRIGDLMALLSTEELIVTLGPFGGVRLLELDRDIPTLADLAEGSTFEQIEEVVDAISAAAVAKFAEHWNAAGLLTHVITPLGAAQVELIAARLDGEQLHELFGTLGVARVQAMAGTKQDNRVAKLYEHRERLVALQAKLAKPDSIVTYWNGIQTRWMEKLWANKPDADVARVLDGVGITALASLLPTMDQAAVYDHATRLTEQGLKGFGEAMKGSELVAVTAPAGAGPATPSDALLKELGTNHAATLKSATALLGAGLNGVLRRCAVHLDAAKTAGFLAKAVTYGWKDAAALTSFFTSAGANIENRVALFETFWNDGNRGAGRDVDGEGPPPDAVHTRTIDGNAWKVAKGDIDHFMSGHIYSTYAMTWANVTRGDSTMWPTGTARGTVEADAATAFNSAAFAALARTAEAGGANGYQAGPAGGFSAGARGGAYRRMTKLYPRPGTQISQARMEAVYWLYASRT